MRWHKQSLGIDEVKALKRRYGCSSLQAAIFLRRNISEDQICYYIEQDKNYLHSPFLLKGMVDAVDRILAGGEEEEKVLIFGDRDVDGISSIVMMVQCLQDLGYSVTWKLPMQNELYGLTPDIIEDFSNEGGTLVVAVDCGSTNYAALERAQSLGIDCVVFDHHALQEPIPPTVALVNPARKDSEYPISDICTATIVMKFCEAIAFAKSEWYNQSLCLLNVRPSNGGVSVDVLQLRNLVEERRMTDTLVPEVARFEDSRLVKFLEGMPIFVFDEAVQRSMLSKIMGKGVDFHCIDIAPKLREVYPVFANKSFLQIQEVCRQRRYKSDASELDMLLFLFRTYQAILVPDPGKVVDACMDLVATATLADMMPLENENRLIARQGLKAISTSKRQGLVQLCKLLNIRQVPSSQDISWRLAPVINASGRMGHPDKAVKLLLAEDEHSTFTLARELVQLNEQRKKASVEAWNMVTTDVAKNMQTFNNKLICIYDKRVLRGVTGIIASRLFKAFHLPAIVITEVDNSCVGSVRADSEFKSTEFLKNFEDFFIGWGGHDGAAGFNLPLPRIADFIEQVRIYTERMEPVKKKEDTVYIDAELPPEYLQPEIINLVNFFEPYGLGYPNLRFLSKNMYIESLAIIGKGDKHFKITLRHGDFYWPAFYWNVDVMRYKAGENVDVIFEVFNESYSQQETLSLNVIGLLPPSKE